MPTIERTIASRFLGREITLIYTVLEASAPARLQLHGENATGLEDALARL